MPGNPEAKVSDKLIYAGFADQFSQAIPGSPGVPVLMNCRRLNAEVTRPRPTAGRILSKSLQNSTQFDHCRFWTYRLKAKVFSPT